MRSSNWITVKCSTVVCHQLRNSFLHSYWHTCYRNSVHYVLPSRISSSKKNRRGKNFTYLFIIRVLRCFYLQNNLKETFKCTYIADMVKVVCKKRGKWDRVIIIIIILSITLINFTTNGIGIVRFQFLRKKLTWTLEKFNYFNCFSHIVTIIGTVMGTMLLNKVFKIKETVVALLGLFSIVGCCLLWGSATKDGYIYLGKSISFLLCRLIVIFLWY